MAERAEALPPPRHEPTDIGLRAILALLALIGGTLVLLLGLVLLVFPGTLQDRRVAQPFPDFPSPRLQPDPPADLRQFEAAELARLNSAGWIDQSAGLVHLPIAQAMHDVAAEGLADWPKPKRTANP